MNWTIHAMRDINAGDPVGGLGPRVTPAPTPAPAPVRRDDGFIVGPDGKLSTDLPDPTVPAVIGGVPVWPFPHMPKADPTHCWHCDQPYDISADRCPHCGSANANVDFANAKAQADAHSRQSRGFRRSAERAAPAAGRGSRAVDWLLVGS